MTTMEDDDETLIGRYARSGDAAAFDQLYKRYEARLWRYLERNVGHQGTSDELLQEIWFTVARNATSLESIPRFRAQLFTLAHDRMADALRARAAAGGRPVAAHDSASALIRAFGELPAEQRDTYLLQAEGDLSLGDIAEITETTVDTVEGRLRLARLKLQELLNEPT